MRVRTVRVCEESGWDLRSLEKRVKVRVFARESKCESVCLRVRVSEHDY